MKSFDVNIIMLTYRSDFIAKINLKIALETINHYSNARLILAYGGDDDYHFNWLSNIRNQMNDKSSFELTFDISLKDRMKWALDFPSNWIIFVSDDDIISSNYLSALINEIEIADDSISNIIPHSYGLARGSNVEYIKLDNILDLNALDRAGLLINSPHIYLRFYSAHRSNNIKEVVREKIESSYFPSYLDQLIILVSILNGKSISCNESSVFIYNIENWMNLEACIRSDSKAYAVNKMVFFHEILWICDYINILHSHCIEKSQYEWIKSYCLSRINDALNSFIPRLNIIDINQSQAKLILDEIQNIAVLISGCHTISDLMEGLNKFKFKILNKTNNEIYFGPYV